MKSNAKHAILFSVLAGLLILAVVIAGIYGGQNGAAVASENGNDGKYYYNELRNSALAQKFYGVLSEMAEDGRLKTGTGSYDLTQVLTQEEIAEYVDAQSAKIPVAFGAARDSFYMDNPDLFYVDLYKIEFQAGMQNGKYVAFINSGRADNYYTSDFANENAVNEAITEYETALNAAVNSAKNEWGNDVVALIEYVNRYIVENVEYDYGALSDAQEGKVYSDYVNSAYGALVKGKAMCGGYSRAFKAVMDRLGVPCALIQGSGYIKGESDSDGGFEAHMWNAVSVGGLWYGVDVTWNDVPNGAEKYVLVGDERMTIAHYADSVISSSGYKLKYPALRPFDYGVNEDKGGFAFKDEGYLLKDEALGDTEENRLYMGYFDSEDPDREGQKYLQFGVSYDGMDYKQLAENGKYLAYRTINEDGTCEVWVDFYTFSEAMKVAGITDVDYPSAQGYTVSNYSYGTYQVQYAVMDIPGNADSFGRYTDSPEDHIIAVSAIYSNDAFGSYVPAPSIVRRTPDNNGWIGTFDPVDITFEYSEKLVKENENKGIGVKITSQHSDIENYARIENLTFDGDKTISFRFYPSVSYTHSQEVYSLAPVNLIGEKSEKKPEPSSYTFKRKSVVCPKVFNDGRMYLSVFGEPQFLGAENLALNDFKDKDGQPVAGNQRSQLMLVVNKPTAQEEEAMENLLTEQTNLEKEDIKASETYQIDLQMCGRIQTIQSGSFMQVGFGFPAGYGPDDEGVTFAVYHYTRKADGTIDTVEEIPCVITKYGIVATVKSFSPFMVCAVDKSKVETKKNIYASVNGVGGTIDNTVIQTVGDGGITYEITPDAKYKINSVKLNGVNITEKVSGGKLSLSKSDLSDGGNVLEVTFISERVDAFYKANNIKIAEPEFIVSPDVIDSIIIDGKTDVTDGGKEKNIVAIAVGASVGGVVLIAGIVVLVLFLRKRKKSTPKKEEK